MATATLEANPASAMLKLDVANAHNELCRDTLLVRVAASLPQLAPLAARMYGGTTTHGVSTESGIVPVRAERGIDQGCPLSQGFFATAVAPVYDSLETTAQTVDALARVLAIHDDVYIVGSPSALEAVLSAAPSLYASCGLRLNASKTQLWNPRNLQLPHGLASTQLVECLVCAGSQLPYVRSGAAADELGNDPSQSSLGANPMPEVAGKHLEAYLRALVVLRASGLKAQDELVLLRTFVNGAALHHARANLLDAAWCRAYDAKVADHLADLLGRELPSHALEQAFMRLRDGGLGLQSLAARRLLAYVGAWQACLADVCSELGADSLESFAAGCPETWAAASSAGRQLGVAADAWLRASAEPLQGAQKALLSPVQTEHRQLLLNALPPQRAAQLRSASGAGAGSWLLPPTTLAHCLADPHFLTAVALRLQLPPPPQASSKCLRCRPDGTPCGADLSNDPVHPCGCQIGGGTVTRHDCVRDWLAAWLKQRGASGVATEQFVPAWDRMGQDGATEAAKLDVVLADPTSGVLYVDVVVTDAAAEAGTPAGRSRARRDGAAAAAAEEKKHRRYPGPALVAFAVETLGRAGSEAQGLLRTWSAGDASVLCEARQSLAVVLQRWNAEAYCAAVLPKLGFGRRARVGQAGEPAVGGQTSEQPQVVFPNLPLVVTGV